ncbi:hypothetical protein EON63_21120 [archaeon]|nr:MAG: hypothetical protein EON63_21120 [archaeon]
MSAIVEAAEITEADGIMAYPEGTPYAENKAGTFWPNLNPNAQKAFDAMSDWVKKENINLDELSLSALDHKLTIMRYLRANNFDTKKSTAHIVRNIDWRKKINVNHIITKRPEDILGYTMAELTVVFPHWQYGFDKTGRPVVYKQYGKFDATKIKKMSGGNYDKVIEYHVWEQEAVGRLCKEQSLKLGRTIETTTGTLYGY